MKKYTLIRKKPCIVLASFAHEKWERATPETNPEYFMTGQAVVVGDDVYVKWPKYQVGIATPIIKGGKWGKVQTHIIKYTNSDNGKGTPETWLAHVGAVPAVFRGAPKL